MLNKSKKRLRSIQKKTAIILFFLLLLSLIYKSTKVSLGLAVGGGLSILNLAALGRIIESVFSQEKPSKALILWQYVIKLLFVFGIIYLLVTYNLVNIIAFITGFSAFLFAVLLEGLFPSDKSPTDP